MGREEHVPYWVHSFIWKKENHSIYMQINEMKSQYIQYEVKKKFQKGWFCVGQMDGWERVLVHCSPSNWANSIYNDIRMYTHIKLPSMYI